MELFQHSGRHSRLGGPVENRARFLKEVVDAIVPVWGSASRRRAQLVTSVATGIAADIHVPLLGTVATPVIPDSSRANSARRVAGLYPGINIDAEKRNDLRLIQRILAKIPNPCIGSGNAANASTNNCNRSSRNGSRIRVFSRFGRVQPSVRVELYCSGNMHRHSRCSSGLRGAEQIARRVSVQPVVAVRPSRFLSFSGCRTIAVTTCPRSSPWSFPS